MHKMLSIILVLAVLLGAACSPENQGMSGTATVSITVEDNTAKTISPDGGVDITHYEITAINEAEGISESSGMLTAGESFTVSNVPAGIWKAEVDAYIQRGTEYIHIAEAAGNETRVPPDSTVNIPVSLDELLDAASGDITLTVMMPAELDDENDAFHYTYEIQGIGQRAEYSYSPDNPIAGVTETGGAAEITIDADAIGLLQGSYLLTVTVFDGATEANSDVVRTGVDAMRLLAGVGAAGRLDLRSQQLSGFRISVTDSVGDILEPEVVNGKDSYSIEATGSLTNFTVEFTEAFDASWTVEWYLDGALTEAKEEGSTYGFSLPKGKHSVIGLIRDESMAMSVGSVMFDIETKAAIVFYEDVTIERYIDLAKNTVIPAGYVNTGYVKAETETEGLTEGDIIFPYEARVPSGIPYDELTPEICGLVPLNIPLNENFSWDEATGKVTRKNTDTLYQGKYLGFSDDVEIIGNGSASEISNETFGYSSIASANLVECYIPESVVSIGSYAFYECSLLDKVSIPEDLLFIDRGAFSGCRNLSEFELPSNLKGLGFLCFNECEKFKRLWIPDSCALYDSNNLEFCRDYPSLEVVRIPSSWTTIPDVGALSNIKEYYIGNELFSGAIPNHVIAIKSSAFENAGRNSGWGSDMDLIIPDSCKSIGTGAFERSSFRSLILTENLEDIGTWAFAYMKNLKGITKWPDNVTEIANYMFYNSGVYGEYFIDLPDTVISIGADFSWAGPDILDNKMPMNLQSIGYGFAAQFGDARVLKFPRTLKEIGSNAFIHADYVFIPKETEIIEYNGIGYNGSPAGDRPSMQVYCEAVERPSGFEIDDSSTDYIIENWYSTSGSPIIHWGVTEEEFNAAVIAAGYGEYL